MPLYMLGRELLAHLSRRSRSRRNTALGIAIMSYNGRLGFGLLGDFDALPDLDEVGAALRDAIAELREASGTAKPARRRRRAAKPKPAAPSEPRPA